VLSGRPAAGTGGVMNLTITATNTAGSTNQAFTLTVNQAPAITSVTSTTFAAGTAGSFTVTATGYPAPTFTTNGPLPSGVTLSSSGLLSGTPAAGTGGQWAFIIVASNGVGNISNQSFSLTVTTPNTPSVISGAITGSGNEDAAAITGTLAAADADGLADNTYFTILGGNQAANGSASINAASGAWSYTPNSDFNGTDAFTVTITDDLGGTTSQVIVITVNPIDDQAVVIGATTGTGNEEAPAITGTLAATDIEGLADNTYFSILSGNQAVNGSASVNAASGAWSYTPNANFNGTDTFTVTITDDLGGTTSQAITITVAAVNDAPLLSTAGVINTVLEDSNNSTAIALWSTVPAYSVGGGVDEASQTLSYRITALPSFISLFKADGSTAVTTNTTLDAAEFAGLKYKTIADGNGSGPVNFDLSDSGSSTSPNSSSLTNQSVTITVTAVNDAPVMSTAGTITGVLEDSNNSTAIALWSTAPAYSVGGGVDEASQTLSYIITAMPSFISLFKADGSTAVALNSTLDAADFSALKYKTIANGKGSGSIAFSVIDSGSSSSPNSNTFASQSVTITVTAMATTVSTWPTATAITYGQTLASSTLSGGVASVPGTFDFTTPGTAPDAGTAAQAVTFTPTDAVNYSAVSGTASVLVNQATATVVLGGLTAVDDGTAKAASATTVPAGLTVGLTYDLSATAPSLPGTYAVVATVSDPNYVGSASGSLVISPKAPVFSGYSASSKPNQAIGIARAKILSRASDPYGGKVALPRVFGPSAQGGTVSLAGNNVTYTPATDFVGVDTFEVELTNPAGGVTRGLVTITVTGTGTAAQNLVQLTLRDGVVDLVFQGIPGRVYVIQRSASLTSWTTVGSATAAADGKIKYTDANPLPSSGFYRTQE
jgi:VCBS repeat-containing protein